MRILIVLFLMIFVVSCDSSRVYEDYENLEEALWHVDSVKRFSFEIKDTSQQYNVLATFRNSFSYPFYNIYFKYSLLDSMDQMVIEELKEAELFDAKTGEPYGSGLGDLFDHSVPLIESFSFSKPGNYTLQLQQFMRMDTLPFILSVGGRVEFAEEQNRL